MGLYIGLMSGTSADAIDAALVDFSPHPSLLATHSLKLSDQVRQQIQAMFTSGLDEVERLGVLDRLLGGLFAQAANELLAKAKVPAEQILAIGSHGQTLRHRPRIQPQTQAFTVQIGDPNTIAYSTGITTVADFRRRDIACGGQGAPLAPAFHQAVFSSPLLNRGILNLGGIANITYLGKDGTCLGFDTGPANGLMDYWIKHCRNLDFDSAGSWAATGRPDSNLLKEFLDHPFFTMPAPKSTGKEEFTPSWLQTCLASCARRPADEDVQATLLELTAQSIAEALKEYPLDELFLCGGGAYNSQLRSRLGTLLPGVRLATTAELGIDVQWVEAMAFAWLAMRTLQGLWGNLPAVTGAHTPEVLGGIYPGRGFRGLSPKNL